MIDIDLRSSVRLPFQLELLTASSRQKNPATLLRMFVEGLKHLYGSRQAMLLSTHGLDPGEYAVTLHVGADGVDRVQAADPWCGRGLPVRSGGLLGGIVARPSPRLIHHLRVAADPVMGDAFAAAGAVAAVPIFDAGAAHNWLLVFDAAPDGFSVAELEELNLRANLVGSTLNHLRVARQLFEAHRYIQQEVERIACIQRSLLPLELPTIDGAELAASYATFDRAGGDLYDVRPARRAADGRVDLWSLLIADASGHGPAAAVMTAVLDALLRAYANDPPGPADMLAYANRLLCGKPIGDSFVTAFLAFYDPVQRTLTYACAGHNPPLLLPRAPEDSKPRVLDDVGGLPVGVEPDVEYDTAVVQVERGQSLLMYTDGVCEAMSPLGELLGMERLTDALAQFRGGPQAMLDRLLALLHRHQCGQRPSDDQTLLALRFV